MPAQHSYKQASFVGDGQKVFSGSFIWNGSAITGVKGKGYTPTRTGAGVFVVTLDTAYLSLLAADANISPNATPSGLTANVAVASSDFIDTAKTQINVWTLNASGNPADPASTTRVNFWFVVSDTAINV